MSFFQYELLAKRLELLKDAVPRVASVAFLYNIDNPGSVGPAVLALENAAKLIKIRLHTFGVRGPDEFEGAFAKMVKTKVDAVALNEDAMVESNLKAIAELANKWRLNSTGGTAFAEAGGLSGLWGSCSGEKKRTWHELANHLCTQNRRLRSPNQFTVYCERR